jgi:hypothetical protein
MVPGSIQVLELGLSLSRSLFELDNARSPELMAVRDYIRESSEQIIKAIHTAVATIIDKIEQDHLELLVSRSQNLSSLVALNRLDQVMHYSMTLRESVDYAQNRFREGKTHWLGPYLAGNSVLLAALRLCDALSDAELDKFNQVVREARVTVLDYALDELVSKKPLPWVELAEFVDGRSTEVLPDRLKVALTRPDPKPETPPASSSCALLIAAGVSFAGGIAGLAYLL